MKTFIKKLFYRSRLTYVINLIKTGDSRYFPEIRQILQSFESKKAKPSWDDNLFILHCGFLAARLNIPERDEILSVVESEYLFRNRKTKEVGLDFTSTIRKSLYSIYELWCLDEATGKKNIMNLRNLILDIYYIGQISDSFRHELFYLCATVENLGLLLYREACKAHQGLMAQKSSYIEPSQFKMLYKSNIDAMEEGLNNVNFALKIAGHKSNQQYDLRHMRNYVQNLKIDHVNI